MAAPVTGEFHPDEGAGGHDTTEQHPRDGVLLGQVHEHIEHGVGGTAGGDGLGEQHGQQQRGLPQIAALTLGEEVRGVAGRPEGAQCSRDGDDLD